ncbi:hypothetical protein D3C71_1533330 [compost metagenome]
MTSALAAASLAPFAVCTRASLSGRTHRHAGQHKPLAAQQIAQLRHALVQQRARLRLITAEGNMRFIPRQRNRNLDGLTIPIEGHLRALCLLIDPVGHLVRDLLFSTHRICIGEGLCVIHTTSLRRRRSRSRVRPRISSGVALARAAST